MYEVDVLRAGTQADFEAWWQAPGELVEPGNVRRGGSSEVWRCDPLAPGGPPLYVKRQENHLFRDWRHPFGAATLVREWQGYQVAESLGIPAPRVVYGGVLREPGRVRSLLVTEALDGYVDLPTWLERRDQGQVERLRQQAVLERVGVLMGRLHRQRWRHGCCYPKHFFVALAPDRSPSVVVLDLEKMRRCWTRRSASQPDLEQFWRRRGTLTESDLAWVMNGWTRSMDSQR